MGCSSCQDNPNPLPPVEINCGYCYWIAHRFISGEVDWTELEDSQGHIVKTCMNDCLCSRPNFAALDLYIGAVVAVKCTIPDDVVNKNSCCTGGCKFKIMYKNPLNPSLGKKWVLFNNGCIKSNCSVLSECYCHQPNVYPDLSIGTVVETKCIYSAIV